MRFSPNDGLKCEMRLIQIYILLLLTLPYMGCSIRPVGGKHIRDNDTIYWNASVGYNWALSKSGIFFEYIENENERKIISYEDVYVPNMTYKINKDSLHIYVGAHLWNAYRIISTDTNSFVVTSPETGWGVDTLRFTKSMDQRTIPKPRYASSSAPVVIPATTK